MNQVRQSSFQTKVFSLQGFVNLFIGSVIYSRSNQVLLVKCKGDSWISVKKIILPGRPSIAAKDFNAGFIANNKGQLIFFK